MIRKWYSHLFLLPVLLVVLIVNWTSWFSPPLSEKEIDELRTTYPVYKGNPGLMSMREPTLEESVQYADTFVLAEVIEQLPEYTIKLISNAQTPEGEIYEKGEDFGLTDTASFLQYRVKIIDDLFDSQLVQKNDADEITISINSEFKGFAPELKPGMKFLSPVSVGTEIHEGRYSYSKYGFYYVTEDDYVLSAFPEDSKAELTGKQIDYVKSALRKIKKK